MSNELKMCETATESLNEIGRKFMLSVGKLTGSAAQLGIRVAKNWNFSSTAC